MIMNKKLYCQILMFMLGKADFWKVSKKEVIGLDSNDLETLRVPIKAIENYWSLK